MQGVILERYKKLNVKVVGVIDVDSAKREMAEKEGIKTMASLEEYLKAAINEKIDFIDICLPTYLHFSALEQVIYTFASSPVAIMVEKPVVRTKEEADKLDELAKNYNQIIFVAEVEHYNKRISDFFESVNNPQKVKIYRDVNLSYFTGEATPWFLDVNLSGGLILDLMVHDFSILDHQLGSAEFVSGRFKQIKFKSIDEATVMLRYYKSNCLAEVIGSWLSTNQKNPIVTTFEIIDATGLKHALIIDDYLIRGSQITEDDPYYLQLQLFIQAITTKKLPHALADYTRVIRLANDIITASSSQLLSSRSAHQRLFSMENPSVKLDKKTLHSKEGKLDANVAACVKA
jgi:UDP-N-acetylglucosamine 3-dehydrogenase